MEIKLKPCPFCGGEAEMMGDLYPYAECQKCTVNFSADHSYNFDFEDAAQKWNSRSTSDAQEITTLRQQLEQAEARVASQHEQILEIHRVTSAIAEVKIEPADYSETLTVRRVKEMAQLINFMSGLIDEHETEAERIRQANIDCVAHYEDMRDELNKANARCAELEQTMYDGNVEREKCQRALILRAQADAVEEAGKEMLEEWPEFDIAHRWLMVQVESLRNQADEIENE